MMTEPSDEQLRHLGTTAFRIAYRLLGSTQDAEDVAQEAVTRTAIRWRRVHGHADAFTSRVATNLSIGILRKRRDLPAVRRSTEHGGLGHLADRIDLIRALRGLSVRQREVIVLRFVGDYSERDIATTLGCSPGAVKKHCARGLAALRLTLPPPERTDDRPTEGVLDAN